MNITLKKWHILFAVKPLVDENRMDRLKVFRKIWDAVKLAATSETPVTIDIDIATIYELFTKMINMQEGLTGKIADESMHGEKAEFKDGLENQLTALAMAGNAEALALAQKIQGWQANYQAMRNEIIARNTQYLENIFEE